MRRSNWLPELLLAVYLLILLRITVFRNGCFSNGLFSGRVEWIPFVYLAKLVRVGYWRYFCYLFFGNLLWFVPFGGYFALRGVRFRFAAVSGLALSLGIEASQFILGSGVSETEDLILNTVGAALGWLLVRAAKNACRRRQSDERRQGI